MRSYCFLAGITWSLQKRIELIGLDPENVVRPDYETMRRNSDAVHVAALSGDLLTVEDQAVSGIIEILNGIAQSVQVIGLKGLTEGHVLPILGQGEEK